MRTRPLRRLVLAAGFVVGVSALAAAQEAPPRLRLDQDVTVTYRTRNTAPAAIAGSFGNYGGTIQLRISTSGWRLQETSIVMPALGPMPNHVTITEVRGPVHRTYLFDEPSRRLLVSDLDTREADYTDIEVFDLDPQTRRVRLGPDTVAGTACTRWRFERDGDGTTEMCVAANGLALRFHSVAPNGITILREATSIVSGPIPRAVFDLPAGWTVVEPRR